VNIDTAERALTAAKARADRAKTDGEKRSTAAEVKRCEKAFDRASAGAAKALERQGYEVSRRR
jgi:hypothetical protein